MIFIKTNRDFDCFRYHITVYENHKLHFMIFIKTNRDFDCFRFIIGLIRTGGISSGFLVPNTTRRMSAFFRIEY